MQFAITIGSFALLPFVELNVRACRHVFGKDTPILICDDRSQKTPEMEALAEKYGCGFITSNTPRGHFCGCSQTTVAAVAFAQAMQADIAVKLTQRFILLEPRIRERIEQLFTERPELELAHCGRPKPEGLKRSKWFVKFPFLVDCMVMRTAAFDPHWLKASYESKCKDGTKHASYTESWLQHLCETKCAGKHETLEWLTNHHGEPHWYLRKTQNDNVDYIRAAHRFGLKHANFPTNEWRDLVGKERYRPIPVMD